MTALRPERLPRLGNLASVTDQAGAVVQYTYDSANQLRSVIQLNHPDPAHHTTAYNYDANGNLNTLTDANSHTTQNGFDVLNQLTTETLPAGPPTQTRTYDLAGNLASLTDYNGKTTNYAYDGLNRREQPHDAERLRCAEPVDDRNA